MPQAQKTTYEEVFTNMLKTYQQVADKAFAINPDKEHVLKLLKGHACQMTHKGGPDGTALFDGECPDGWIRCPNGDCVPIIIGC